MGDCFVVDSVSEAGCQFGGELAGVADGFVERAVFAEGIG